MQTFTFDTGPEGAVLTQANTGASAAPTINAPATAVFASSAAAHGSYGAKFTAASTTSLVRYSTESSSNIQAWSFVGSFSAFNATNTTASFFVPRYASGPVMRLSMSSAGAITVADVGVPTTQVVAAAGTLTAGTKYRFSIVVTGGSTSAGSYTVKVYNNATGTQVGSTVSSTSANMTANPITAWDIGWQSAPGTNAIDFTLDDLQQETGRTTEIPAYVPSANVPPVVSASSPNTTTIPNSSVTLNGVATDSDGTIASNAWDFAALPSGVTAPTLTGGNTNQATFTPTIAGLYVARYTATDNGGSASSATVNIYVGGTVAQVISVTSNTGLWTVAPSTSNTPTVLSDNDPNTYIESPASPSVAAPIRLRLGPLQPLTTFSMVLGGVTINGIGNLSVTANLYEGSTLRKQWTNLSATGADDTLTLSPTEIASISTLGWNTLDVEVTVIAV